MITLIKRTVPGRESDSLAHVEICGLSSDTKPTGDNIAENSFFVELDTGKLYYYSGANWTEFGTAPTLDLEPGVLGGNDNDGEGGDVGTLPTNDQES